MNKMRRRRPARWPGEVNGETTGLSKGQTTRRTAGQTAGKVVRQGRLAAIAAAIATGLAAPAAAQSATEALYSCADKADTAERLACYDEAVGRLRSAESRGDVVTMTAEEIAEAQVDEFGRSGAAPNAVEERLAAAAAKSADGAGNGDPDRLEAGILSIGETRTGALIVTLDNGQVWRQTDSTLVAVSRKAPPKTATIRSAALGSYRMKLGRSRAFRAERVN